MNLRGGASGGVSVVRASLRFPVAAVVTLFSRRRLLRFALAVLYFGVLTPLAAWQRLFARSQVQAWRRAEARPGWVSIRISSSDKALYKGES